MSLSTHSNNKYKYYDWLIWLQLIKGLLKLKLPLIQMLSCCALLDWYRAKLLELNAPHIIYSKRNSFYAWKIQGCDCRSSAILAATDSCYYNHAVYGAACAAGRLLRFLIGSAMAIIGVILFLTGVRTGILPMGKAVGAELPQHQSSPARHCRHAGVRFCCHCDRAGGNGYWVICSAKLAETVGQPWYSL